MGVETILTIGRSVNNLIINHPVKLYNKRIEQLNGYISKLDSHISTMQDLRNQLSQFWVGDAADRYALLLDTQLNSLESSREIVNRDMLFYQDLISNLDETKTKTNALMGDAESILKELGSELSGAAASESTSTSGGGFR